MQLTVTQQVGLKFLIDQEKRVHEETIQFVRQCILELGLEPSKNYRVTEIFELVEQGELKPDFPNTP